MQTGDKFTEVGESKVLFHYERLQCSLTWIIQCSELHWRDEQYSSKIYSLILCFDDSFIPVSALICHQSHYMLDTI